MSIYSLIEQKKKDKKRKQNKNMAKAAVLGTVIGGALGVASGVLLAPKSGKETREDLKQKSGDVKEQVSNNTKKIKEKINIGLDEGKDNLKVAKKRIAEYLETKKEGQAIEAENSIDVENIDEVSEEGLNNEIVNDDNSIQEDVVRREENVIYESEEKVISEV